MSPLLSPRASLLWLCSLVAACSTPISPYSTLDDEDPAQDELPVVDAGPSRDSGARDAGSRDAGSRDAGANAPNCARIASAPYYATLIDDDCARRTTRVCAAPGQSPQLAINQLVTNLAARCGVPANAGLSVGFSPSGCPKNFGSGADLRGRVTQCIQNELETWRLSCSLGCAGTDAFAR